MNTYAVKLTDGSVMIASMTERLMYYKISLMNKDVGFIDFTDDEAIEHVINRQHIISITRQPAFNKE